MAVMVGVVEDPIVIKMVAEQYVFVPSILILPLLVCTSHLSPAVQNMLHNTYRVFANFGIGVSMMGLAILFDFAVAFPSIEHRLPLSFFPRPRMTALAA